jgi:fatty acid desaturase
MMRDTALCWALIIAAWVGAAAIRSWWALALAFVIIGNRYYALFIIGHDGLHRRLFEDSGRNDLYCDVLLLGPIGAITRINNRNHLAHHQFLSTDADPDRYKHVCLDKGTGLSLAGYLSGTASVTRGVQNVFLSNGDGNGTADQAPAETKSRPRYRLRDVLILAAWQGALAITLTKLFGWWGYLLLWWAPVFVLTFLPDNLRTFAEHSHPEADAAADEHRLITNLPGWLERQLLAPMNMHYHATHHLWPSIPYYNLPIADAEIRKAANPERIEWRGSYVAYLWRYVRALPIEGCSPAASRG